jgi:hypothetical protein
MTHSDPDHSSLSPPPRSQSQPSTAGWVMVLGIGLVVQTFGILVYWDKVTSLRYDLTDSHGVAVPFPSSGMWQNGWDLFLFVATPCLVALGLAVIADRHWAWSTLACLALVVFSVVAVGGGAMILTRSEATYRCEACLDPPSYGNGSCDEQMWPPGGDYFDTVPCPADFQEGAMRVEQAIDRDAIALMAFGGIGVVAGSVLFVRSRRGSARHGSLRSAGTT